MQNTQTFWLISAPSRGGQMLESLNNRTKALSENRSMNIPKLRAGTLDSLMTLSDDLAKQDQQTESVLRKLERQMFDLELKSFYLQIDRKNVTTTDYVLDFKWVSSKYQEKQSLMDISSKIHQEVLKVDEELRMKQSDYNQIRSQSQAHSRKKEGNLAARSLSSLPLNKADFIDTENFLTIIVVVPKMDEKTWLQTYEQILPKELGFFPILLKSSKKVFDGDDENDLWTCTVFRRKLQDFKIALREKQPRWTVREFQFDESAMADERSAFNEIKSQEEKSKKSLAQWCKAMYGEVFKGFVHLKVIRLFVESCLRYGVPPDFVCVVMKIKDPRDEKKVRKLLETEFQHLASSAMFGTLDDSVPAAMVGQEFYPYVYLPLTVTKSEGVEDSPS
jgi:V-type H+-transporting ATPase subunit C